MVGNPLDGLSSIFFAGDKNDPRVNMQLRQRIALQLMAKRNPYPKNVGEGLSAIGDAIGDRGLMRQLEQQDLAAQKGAEQYMPGINGAGPSAPPPAAVAPSVSSYAPPSGDGGGIDVAAATPDAAPPVQAPPDLVNTPNQPLSVLSSIQPPPDLTTQPSTPEQTASLMSPTMMTPPPRPTPPPPDAALAGMPPAPAYMRDAIARNIQNPAFRAYAGRLTGKEARNAQDVSPTGAAGPFQFIPSTARQYGLKDPTDLDASTIAFKKFTQDNAAAFEKINGRPPTMPELALMHQQGGVTGARMIAGTGNASPRNLAVNNIDPNAGPGQAAAAIQKYYGMPNVPVDVRDNIAATMTAQAQPRPAMPGAAPMVPPMMAQGGDPPSEVVPDQRLAFNGPPQQAPLPPAISSGIQKAPPNVQLAQAAPPQEAYPPGYVPPKAADPTGAPAIGMGPAEADLTRKMIQEQNRGNTYAVTAIQAQLAPIQAERAQRQAEANEIFKAKLQQVTKQNELNLTGSMDSPKRIADIDTTRQEQTKRAQEIADAAEKSALQQRLGGRDPEKFFTEFNKEKDSAGAAASALDHYALAREMLDKGVIVGTGQGWKVNAAKVAGAFGIKDQAEAVARTEQLEAGIKSTLRLAVENIQGAGGKVSDTDVKVASGTIGADPAQQLETIKRLVAEGQKAARTKLNSYEDQKDYYVGGTRAEKQFEVPVKPTAPQPHIDTLLKHRTDNEAVQEFDRRFGPGAAELEIARAKRRERRGG